MMKDFESTDDLINAKFAAMATAFGEVLKDRLNAIEKRLGVESRSPPVYNEIKFPSQMKVLTEMDLQPLSRALEKFMGQTTDTVDRLAAMQEANAKTLQQLLEVLVATAERPAAIVNVAPPLVSVEAPQVTVQMPERRQRSMLIEHDDGSTSKLTEE
jgi:hypothetical protein